MEPQVIFFIGVMIALYESIKALIKAIRDYRNLLKVNGRFYKVTN